MVIIRVQQRDIEWNKRKVGFDVGKTRTNFVKNCMLALVFSLFDD
jgi:hypothetical protein